MDAELLEAAITARTKAVIPVHLHGQPADMQPILAVARRHGLTVIEDAAQAHGARWEGRRVGSIGHLGCFSFYPGKNLGACGEGGMVVTNNADHAKAIRLLRDWGQDRKYHHALRGFNFRMDGLQGAILREKLRHLDRWNEARRARASTYDKLLAGADVRLPSTMPFAEHVFHVYAIRHGQRDALQRALSDRAIQTGIHYPIPVHLQPAFADLGYQAGDFPVAEAAASQTLSLPLFPEITEDMQRQVADAIVQSTADLRPLALPVAES
jgi:dTDP-4-amino-4,6-dideoxygalactose transaminase